MKYQEIPFFFPCDNESLLGVIAVPNPPGSLGVLVLVGGPQYHIGSHRQFVHLSRYLAAHGIPCMRFDYRGMGDSTGETRTFEEVLPDTRAAVDAFFSRLPELQGVVLWGLCDGASAACFYAFTDSRVVGLVLLNPWVRTEQSEAKTYLRHYYMRRLMERDFWSKVFHGRFDARGAAHSLYRMVASAWRQHGTAQDRLFGRVVALLFSKAEEPSPLPSRMAARLSDFRGRILIILSGNDYTALEFRDMASASDAWKNVLAGTGVTVKDLPRSDHTFSRREWAEQVANFTVDWVSISNAGQYR